MFADGILSRSLKVPLALFQSVFINKFPKDLIKAIRNTLNLLELFTILAVYANIVYQCKIF